MKNPVNLEGRICTNCLHTSHFSKVQNGPLFVFSLLYNAKLAITLHLQTAKSSFFHFLTADHVRLRALVLQLVALLCQNVSFFLVVNGGFVLRLIEFTLTTIDHFIGSYMKFLTKKRKRLKTSQKTIQKYNTVRVCFIILWPH